MSDLFEYYFEHKGLHAKYARSLPSVSGQEFHSYYEFVFFLGGQARFISKSIQKRLVAGNVIFVPKNAFHQFMVDDCDYTRFILSFRGEKALHSLLSSLGDEPLLIDAPDPIVSSSADGLIQIIKDTLPPEEKALYLSGAIIQLLFAFRKKASGTEAANSNLSEIVREALLLIDKSYTLPDTTLAWIASELNTSESLLSHRFKTEMNIPVYQYITKKRLAAARDFIRSGTKITAAAGACGFCDYSCFFRAYKKEYGHPPSATDVQEDYLTV